MATIDQVHAQIRFALEQLSARNGHHEFEHLCRHFARQRICSNILPATGPVSSGGDQARDFETFQTYLSGSAIAQSSFIGLVAENPVAFCCSLQKSAKSKIKADVKTIASSGTPVDAVYYFCAEDLAVAQRHEVQAWALKECGIRLEILDGQAISEQLSDPDVFWIAEQYLKVPRELYPNRPSPNKSSDASLPNFVGREAQLSELKDRLSQRGAFVPVIGMPGLGKTYLAREFIRRSGQLFEMVYELDCEKKDLAVLTGELAGLLGLRLEGQAEQVADELRRRLASKRCLLLLDNVDGNQPSALVPDGSAAVLVTSRDGTIPFLANHEGLTPPLFTDLECMELFRRVLVNFPEEDAKHLFAKLGHLPMAIAVAAGLIKHDVRHTVKSLATSLPPLDTFAIGTSNVGHLLVDAIGALHKREQQLIRAMAACAPGAMSFHFAAEVAGLRPDTALDALQGLYARSLVVELDREARRYRLHPLIREAAAPAETVRQKHGSLVEIHLRGWAKSPRTYAQFLDEAEQALNSLDRRFGETIVAIGTKAGSLAHAIGRWNEAYRFYERVESEGATAGNTRWLEMGMANRAAVLFAWGRLGEAMTLLEKAEVICRQMGDRAGLQATYGNRALILQQWGQLDQAMVLHSKREEICKDLGDREGLAITYSNEAGILKTWGRVDEAMELLQKAEVICEELGDGAGLARSYANQSHILKVRGQLEQAMVLLERAETIFQKLGDCAALAQVYCSRAMILKEWRRFDEAMELTKQEEAICSELNDRAGLQRSFGVQALIEQLRGRLGESMALHKKEELLCQELGNRVGMATCCGNQAAILKVWGRLDEAMTLLQKQEAICDELRDPAGLLQSCGAQADILRESGRSEAAIAVHLKAEAICLEIGDRAALARVYGNWAETLRVLGQREEAMAQIGKAETIFREIVDRSGIGRTCVTRALILRELGRREDAVSLLLQEEQICLELGDRARLAAVYDYQALIRKEQSDLVQATALLAREDLLCTELNDRAGLARTYGHQALILSDAGKLDEAMALHREEEAILQSLGDHAELRHTYGNQALVLRRLGRRKEAMELLERAELLCEERNDRTGLAKTYQNQALILQDWGRLEDATVLLQKCEAICEVRNDREGLAGLYRQWGLLERRQMLDGTKKLRAALSIFAELNMSKERDELCGLLPA